mmetsp:Transcript_36261/g.114422  ORF Transcript_36261/g.114422 Transcript_36261/m.114422 type:complete len:230 (+) Transcript_36261:88-777(+)
MPARASQSQIGFPRQEVVRTRPGRGRGATFVDPPAPASHLPHRRCASQVTKCQEEGGDPSALVMPSAPSGPPKLWARMASVLPYFIPWIDMLGLIFPLLYSFPQWAVFFYMPMWLLVVYGAHMLVPLIIFFAIYLCIVRNNKMPHFLRFNCLQAVLIDIAGMLVTLLDMYMPGELSLTLFKTLFCGIAATSMLYAIFYCMFCAIFGIYAEIPEISNAVYIQVQQASSGQ